MADSGMPNRPGYTRGGKSLKAVRRYYALKNAGRRRPADGADEEDKAKKRRSPDDDKLSKRIAAELRTQQEANEKRNRQVPEYPAERSGVKVVMQHNDTGPLFVAETVEPAKQAKSVDRPRSAKSVKSVKSVGTVGQIQPTVVQTLVVGQLGMSAIGCLIACLVFALVYITTWIFMSVLKRHYDSTGDIKNPDLVALSSVTWLGITSLVDACVVPYWLWMRSHFRHSLTALAAMVLSTLSISVHLVYSIMVDSPPADPSANKSYLNVSNPLNFCLCIINVLYHLISISFMVNQLLAIVSKNIEEKSDHLARNKLKTTEMSEVFAPPQGRRNVVSE